MGNHDLADFTGVGGIQDICNVFLAVQHRRDLRHELKERFIGILRAETQNNDTGLPFIGSIKLIAVFSDADRTDKVIDAVRSAMRERQSARQTG